MNVIKKTTELWNAGHRIISVKMTEKKIEYQAKTIYNWFHQYKLIAEKNYPIVIDAIITQYKIEQNENNEIIKNLEQWTQKELQ
jgi:hypothetical protein